MDNWPLIVFIAVVYLLERFLGHYLSFETYEDPSPLEFDAILNSLEGSGEVVSIETLGETYSGTVVRNGLDNIVIHTPLSSDDKIARWELRKEEIIGVGFYLKHGDNGEPEKVA